MVGDDDFLGQRTPTNLDEVIERQRQRLKEAHSEGRSPAVIAYLADLIEGLPAARAEFTKATLVSADETFSERLVLHRGDRRIELLHFGIADTRGDVIVWLPKERIVAAGDVVGADAYSISLVRNVPHNWTSHLRRPTEKMLWL